MKRFPESTGADVTHCVRSGDFVLNMIRASQNVEERLALGVANPQASPANSCHLAEADHMVENAGDAGTLLRHRFVVAKYVLLHMLIGS